MIKPELSIITVNYNTSRLTFETVESIVKSNPDDVKKGKYEIIVSDNGSVDDSIKVLKDYKKKEKLQSLIILENNANLGFAKANNTGVKLSKGEYVLFLNPDTIVYPKTLHFVMEFIKSHPNAGLVTCKLEMLDGNIDYASHRGFPTPWNAFCYFSKLSKMFPKVKMFNGYTLSYMDMHKIHEVDSIAGAFMLLPRKVGEEINWWPDEYFFDGEDIDFCYQVRKLGYKIYYVPDVKILHYNGATSGIKKSAATVTTADLERKLKMQNYRFNAMKIFYKKYYSKTYPKWMMWIVFRGIDYLHSKTVKKLKKTV